MDNRRAVTQPALELAPIRLLHRHDDHICLERSEGEHWHQVGAIRASNLESLLPLLWDECDLSRDSFYSVNGFFRPGVRARTVQTWVPAMIEGQHVEVRAPVTRRQNQIANAPHGLLYASRCRENVSQLNAVFCDLDGYKVGRSVSALLAEVHEAQESELIPRVSMMAYSGRGLWLFWLLRDEQIPDVAQRAYPNQRRAYVRVMRALQRTLAPLGADPRSLDLARVTRIPGSVNSKSDTRVRYYIHLDESGSTYTYTLSALSALCTADDEEPIAVRRAFEPNKPRAILSNRQMERNRKGYQAAVACYLRDLHVLIDLRGGGFARGCRNVGAYYLALILFKSGATETEIARRVRTFADRCQPSLSRDEWTKAVRQASRAIKKFPKYTTISEQLQVTASEAVYLEKFRQAGASTIGPTTPASASTRLLERRSAITAYVETCRASSRRTPSERDTQSYLATHGIEVSAFTVHRDYTVLGIHSANRAGRPQKQRLFEAA